MPGPDETPDSSAPEQPAAADDTAGTTGAGTGGTGTEAQSQMVANRHDRLFKAAVAVPENAVSLLCELLPKELLDLLDFSRMRRLPTEYISELLQERRLDVVYEVPMFGGGDMLLHLIVDLEVQYAVDELMAFRCWYYAVLLTDDYLKRHAKDRPIPPEGRRIPPVHSVVVHQAAKGTWNKPTDLLGIYHNAEKLAELEPVVDKLYRGGFTLWDLGAEEVQQILAREHLTTPMRAILLVLAIEPSTGDLYGDLLAIRDVLRAAARALSEVYVFLNSSPKIENEQLRELFDRQLGPEGQEAAMSIIEQERAQTKTETLARTLLSLLRAKFEEVPQERVEAVQKATDSDLDRWLIQVLNASTIDEVFR